MEGGEGIDLYEFFGLEKVTLAGEVGLKEFSKVAYSLIMVFPHHNLNLPQRTLERFCVKGVLFVMEEGICSHSPPHGEGGLLTVDETCSTGMPLDQIRNQ